MLELERMRERIKLIFPGPRNQYPVSCNGIRFKQASVPSNLIEALNVASANIKNAQSRGLYYCLKEWSKVALFIQYHISLHKQSDLELFELFELSRTSQKCNVNMDNLAGSVGMLFDQFMSVFWIFIISNSGSLTVFMIRIDSQSYMSKLQKLLDICSQNTETLRNTEIVSQCSEKKAQWWKIRKNLDFELSSLCSEFDEELFLFLPVNND